MLGRDDSKNPSAPRGPDLGLPLGEKLVRACWKPYVPEYPNVGFLRHGYLGREFGCVVCKQTWMVPEAALRFSTSHAVEVMFKSFELHRHEPEPDNEPLDPSGVPRV